jgi:hypothetical protein
LLLKKLQQSRPLKKRLQRKKSQPNKLAYLASRDIVRGFFMPAIKVKLVYTLLC